MDEPENPGQDRRSNIPPRTRTSEDVGRLEPPVAPPIPGEYEPRLKPVNDRFKKSDLSSGSE